MERKLGTSHGYTTITLVVPGINPATTLISVNAKDLSHSSDRDLKPLIIQFQRRGMKELVKGAHSNYFLVYGIDIREMPCRLLK
jgi:hypothetical protein